MSDLHIGYENLICISEIDIGYACRIRMSDMYTGHAF